MILSIVGGGGVEVVIKNIDPYRYLPEILLEETELPKSRKSTRILLNSLLIPFQIEIFYYE
jgi:hypothetical protein